MTALVVYGSSVAATTVTTADKMSTTTGGTETTKNTTGPSDASSGYIEALSQGGTDSSSAGSLPSPTGKGYLLDATTLEGQTIAAGNWSAIINIDSTTGFVSAIAATIRFYKRSSGGTYTSIGSIVSSNTTITGSKQQISFSNTSLSSVVFATGDKLYVDLFYKPTTGNAWVGDVMQLYVSNSGTAGVANDMQITTPGYSPSGTTVNKDLKTRFRLGKALDLVTRFRLGKALDLSSRFRLQKALDLSSRFRLSALANKDLASRFRLQKALDLSSRFRLSALKNSDLAGRFNLGKALDLSSRFNLQKALDLSTRFNLRAPINKDLSTRFRLFTPSYTNVDASYQKFQVIKVYDPTGVFLGTIDDATYITAIKDTINAASDAIHIILPRKIDAYDGANQPGSAGTIAMGNNIQIWMYGAGIAASGVLRFNGIIDTITPKLDTGSESVDVLCTPYSQLALGDHAVTTTLNIGTSGSSSTYIDTGVMFSQFFTGSYVNSAGSTVSTVDAVTGNPYGAPYTMDPASASATTQKSQFSFQNQTILSALSNVLLLSPANYFFRMNPNKTVFFGLVPNTPTYTLLLGQHITSIEFPQDNVPRKNLVVIQGNGTVKGTYTGSSVSTLGQRVYFKADNRITDTNTAQALANGIGAVLDQTVIRAKVKIPDYRGDAMPGLGYDIEKFQVGETVKIIDARAPASSAVGAGSVWGGFVWGGGKWGAASSGTPTIWGSFNWGQATWGTSLGTIFETVLPIMAITRSFHYCELEVGFRAPTINKKIFDLEAKLADATLLG